MTTQRQVTILAAAAIMRNLRGDRNVLNSLASRLQMAAMVESESDLAADRIVIGNMRDSLHNRLDLDGAFLAEALDGVLLLLIL